MSTAAGKKYERVTDPDTAQEIRLLRHSLEAMRKQVNLQFDGFDARLARLEPEEGVPSEQFPHPSDTDGWLKALRAGYQ